MLREIFLIVLFVCFWSGLSLATNIKGKLQIKELWEPVVYLSIINSFDDLNTASYDFLIYEAVIDENGFFEITNLELPENDRIYRLHICKIDDPVSTIIIGGKDENFVHFVMNNKSEINIRSNKNSAQFKDVIVEGYLANESLIKLFTIQNELLSPPDLPSMQNRQLLREHILKSFQNMADTSSYIVIKLLAVYLINESFIPSDQLSLMEKIESGIQDIDTSSPYYLDFKDELEYLKFQSKTDAEPKSFWYIWTAIISIIIVLFILNLLSNKTPSTKFKDDNTHLLSLLSIQERKVLDLLKEGKSNKEISNELHIEVSTVKSHLNKIYYRLRVKSRKEIVNGVW